MRKREWVPSQEREFAVDSKKITEQEADKILLIEDARDQLRLFGLELRNYNGSVMDGKYFDIEAGKYRACFPDGTNTKIIFFAAKDEKGEHWGVDPYDLEWEKKWVWYQSFESLIDALSREPDRGSIVDERLFSLTKVSKKK